MAEYIERKAAIELFQNAQFEYTAEEAAEFVLRIPAADVVEVVRCKDCKWWVKSDCKNDTHGYIPLNENDFCSRGERREKDD